MTNYYDEELVTAISHNVASTVNAATFDAEMWKRVPAVLSESFPGSFCGIWNLNFAENRLLSQSWANIDPHFAKSYADHYAEINPWTRYWSTARNGHVALSEQVCPATSFANTEFYNDWLRPQPGSEAAAGLKIMGDRGEMIQVVLHFPLSLSSRYDQATIEVMRRISGSLRRHIDFSRQMRTDIEKAVTSAALVERSREAAFVVDSHRRVREANASAERLFARVAAVTIRNERCFFLDAVADALFGSILAGRSQGTLQQGGQTPFRAAANVWQLRITPLPTESSSTSSGLLLPPGNLFLVLVADMNVGASEVVDLTSLKTMFGLTTAEIAFCRRLILGESLAEAAEQLGIATETARSRIKSIFFKTGTSRQGQLLLLLARLL